MLRRILLVAFALGLIAAFPAMAQEVEGVCDGLDSGKIDVVGSMTTVTVTAPEGFLIDRYCVKAGSIQQGDGPEYVDVVPPQEEVTFGHSTGKDVSHYAVSYVAAPTSPPPTTTPPPTETTPPPTQTTPPPTETTPPPTETTPPPTQTTPPPTQTTPPPTSPPPSSPPPSSTTTPPPSSSPPGPPGPGNEPPTNEPNVLASTGMSSWPVVAFGLFVSFGLGALYLARRRMSP